MLRSRKSGHKCEFGAEMRPVSFLSTLNGDGYPWVFLVEVGHRRRESADGVCGWSKVVIRRQKGRDLGRWSRELRVGGAGGGKGKLLPRRSVPDLFNVFRISRPIHNTCLARPRSAGCAKILWSNSVRLAIKICLPLTKI